MDHTIILFTFESCNNRSCEQGVYVLKSADGLAFSPMYDS
eukprot:SAG11_NODE_20889_length_436_cov_0.922849_1_plen_39_part_10